MWNLSINNSYNRRNITHAFVVNAPLDRTSQLYALCSLQSCFVSLVMRLTCIESKSFPLNVFNSIYQILISTRIFVKFRIENFVRTAFELIVSICVWVFSSFLLAKGIVVGCAWKICWPPFIDGQVQTFLLLAPHFPCKWNEIHP